MTLSLPLSRTALCTAAALLLLGLASGCTSDLLGDDGGADYQAFFNFAQGEKSGWTAGFADYPSNTPETDFELAFEVRDLPQEVGPGKALFLSSHNRSDDLFMFLRREITGLEPNTSYEVTLRVKLASNAGTGCAGVGGAPGESVYLKVGASTVEPAVVVEDNFHTVPVDKGQQSQSGRDAVVAGDLANGLAECSDTAPYRMIERSNRDEPVVARSDAAGKLWVFVGTDSAFEGRTSLYYSSIEVLMEER